MLYSTLLLNIMCIKLTCSRDSNSSFLTTQNETNNVSLFFNELQQLHSRICCIVDIINTTKASDDQTFTNTMLGLVGKTFQIQQKLHNLNFDEFRLRTELNMTDNEVDKAKHLYFNTHKILSIFMSK